MVQCCSRVASACVCNWGSTPASTCARFFGGRPGIALGRTCPSSLCCFAYRLSVERDAKHLDNLSPGITVVHSSQNTLTYILRVRFHQLAPEKNEKEHARQGLRTEFTPLEQALRAAKISPSVPSANFSHLHGRVISPIRRALLLPTRNGPMPITFVWLHSRSGWMGVSQTSHLAQHGTCHMDRAQKSSPNGCTPGSPKNPLSRRAREIPGFAESTRD